MDIKKLIENLEEWHENAISELCADDQLTCDDLCGCRSDCIVLQAIKALRVLAAYDDTGMTPEQIRNAHETLQCFDDIGIKRGNEIVTAEAEGRLVVLPCKVGDIVYYIHQEKTILPGVAKWFETNDGWTVCVQHTPMAPKFFRFADFGKTCFLTREEAEKALAKEADK